MHAHRHDVSNITRTHAHIHARKVVARLEARTELEHMLYACKDEAEARGSARLEALAQSVEEWLEGLDAGAVEVAVCVFVCMHVVRREGVRPALDVDVQSVSLSV